MATLRDRFVSAAGGQAEALEHCLAAGDLAEVRRIAHGLAGRAGMFGFDRIGELALVADEADNAVLPERAAILIATLRALIQER